MIVGFQNENIFINCLVTMDDLPPFDTLTGATAQVMAVVEGTSKPPVSGITQIIGNEIVCQWSIGALAPNRYDVYVYVTKTGIKRCVATATLIVKKSPL